MPALRPGGTAIPGCGPAFQIRNIAESERIRYYIEWDLIRARPRGAQYTVFPFFCARTSCTFLPLPVRGEILLCKRAVQAGGADNKLYDDLGCRTRRVCVCGFRVNFTPGQLHFSEQFLWRDAIIEVRAGGLPWLLSLKA